MSGNDSGRRALHPDRALLRRRRYGGAVPRQVIRFLNDEHNRALRAALLLRVIATLVRHMAAPECDCPEMRRAVAVPL